MLGEIPELPLEPSLLTVLPPSGSIAWRRAASLHRTKPGAARRSVPEKAYASTQKYVPVAAAASCIVT